MLHVEIEPVALFHALVVRNIEKPGIGASWAGSRDFFNATFAVAAGRAAITNDATVVIATIPPSPTVLADVNGLDALVRFPAESVAAPFTVTVRRPNEL